MSYECIRLQAEAEGQIQVLTLTRPQALNALNQQLLKELDQVLTVLQEDTRLRCLVVTGEGEKAFVAGADIREMQNHDASRAHSMAKSGQSVFDRLSSFKCPVVAAVNGFALGGGLELALACDFILASENAKLGLPEVSLGLIPGYGGTQRLSRVVGKAWARRLTLTGEMLNAAKALEIGLVTEVVNQDQLLNRSLELAKLMASRAPKALYWARQAVNEGAETSIEEGLKLEAKLFSETFKTDDHNEGIAAFVEKRKANFEGK